MINVSFEHERCPKKNHFHFLAIILFRIQQLQKRMDNKNEDDTLS